MLQVEGILCLFLILFGRSDGSLLNSLLVTPNDSILLTTSSNDIIILSASLQETICSSNGSDNIINGGVIVDQFTGDVIVCYSSNTCTQLNTANCQTDTLDDLSLNSNENSTIMLYSINDTLYAVSYINDSIQLVKYENSLYVWDILIDNEDSSMEYLALFVDDSDLYMTLTSNNTQDIVLIKIIDELSTATIDYKVLLVQIEEDEAAMIHSLIHNEDIFVLIAINSNNSGIVNIISLSQLNEHCQKVRV